MYIRLFISFIILSLIFFWVDTNALLNTFAQLDWLYVFYLLIFSVILIWASCLKWQVFIRASGHDVDMWHLMKLYTVGYFFNTFTPSIVGGDVARSFHLGKKLSSQRDAFAATFLERFTGLLAMSLLGVAFVAYGSDTTKGVELAVLAVGFGSLLVALVCFSEGASKLFFSLAIKFVPKFAPKKHSETINRLLSKVELAMGSARNDLPLFTKAMLLSLLFHVLTVLNTYIAAQAVGWTDPQLQDLFVVVPLVLLVSMVPLTPNGLGIQEGAFLFFLKRIGATEAQALSIGIVLRIKLMLIAVVGGILWSTLRSSEKSAVSLEKS